ncbi:MAG: tripartite tricarboxylate transporter substrate binding protein [Betaproteobacteria bacterium]|nr:tripartite tricarboxylate transporter substrate binding protein [Betaproteobacteria bacterium]
MKLTLLPLCMIFSGYLCALNAFAQSFPSKPIRIIVPYVGGGAVDGSARVLAVPMSEAIGQPVLVENRPGASSMVGMQACAKSASDGYTTCMTVADSLSYNPFLFKNLPYDADRDFAPVINLARGNSMLVAKGGASFNSFKEMIATAKSKPGALNWGTWGPASVPDMYLQWIRHQVGVDIAAVPYKGAGQAVPALLAGEVDVTYMTIGAMLPHIKAGKVKSLAVVGGVRSPSLPNVPHLVEEGADPGLRSYFGIFAPGGTPKPIVDRLNAEFAKALQAPKVQEYLRTLTLDIVGGSADDFAQFLREDKINSGRVFKTMGVKPGDSPS